MTLVSIKLPGHNLLVFLGAACKKIIVCGWVDADLNLRKFPAKLIVALVLEKYFDFIFAEFCLHFEPTSLALWDGPSYRSNFKLPSLVHWKTWTLTQDWQRLIDTEGWKIKSELCDQTYITFQCGLVLFKYEWHINFSWGLHGVIIMSLFKMCAP